MVVFGQEEKFYLNSLFKEFEDYSDAIFSIRQSLQNTKLCFESEFLKDMAIDFLNELLAKLELLTHQEYKKLRESRFYMGFDLGRDNLSYDTSI